MLEANYTSQIILPRIKSRVGGVWIKIHGGFFQVAGIPDLIGVVRGRFFAVEVKMPTNKVGCSKKQIEMIKAIRKAGGFAQVVRTIEDVDYYFSKDKKTGKYKGRLEEPRYND